MISNQASFSLAVAIPTFNRNDILARVLSSLSVQFAPNTGIYVLDNNPDGSAIDAIKQSKVDDVFPLIHIRWPGNIGGNENIIRCVEFAEADYVWILGDDDFPVENALSTIRSHITKHPDASVFNFYWPDKSHLKRSSSIKCNSFSEYLDQFKSVGESLFISSLVFKRLSALQALSCSYQWQSSCCPGMTLAYSCFSDRSYGFVSHKQIVEYREENTVHSSVLSIAAGMTTLNMLPLAEAEFKSLQRLSCWFSPLTLIKQALVISHRAPSRRSEVSRCLRIVSLSFCMRPFHLIGRVSLLILSALLTNTRLSQLINIVLSPLLRNASPNLSLDR